MFECVVNISEGTDRGLIGQLRAAAGAGLIDVHSDVDHNRSVLTLAGERPLLESAVRDLGRAAVDLLDLRTHRGVHPRLGVLDVVPWVDLSHPWDTATTASISTRDRFAQWAAAELGLPCFLYGPERSLPDVRRGAWATLAPDTGPSAPHDRAGACAVGARAVMVAYNLWLAGGGEIEAKLVARRVRTATVRTLGLVVGGRPQVSCNLIDPRHDGPAQAYDAVARLAPVERAELVGLLPDEVLRTIPRHRWAELDVSPERTIEGRLPSS